MENKESIGEQVRKWIFPSVMSLLSLLIWSMVDDIKSDIADVKADIKTLMAQSNIDKTRIDNLERQVYKINATSYPSMPPVQEPELIKRVAILPKEDELYAKK
jgi:hypothetical protein